MRLTWRDGIATLAVAVATGGYLLWLNDTIMTSTSTRVVAALVLALGVAGCTMTGDRMGEAYGVGGHDRAPTWYLVATSTAGAVALVAGLVAIIWASELMLGVLVAATVALWALSTGRHLVLEPTRPVHRLTVHHSGTR